MNERYPFDANAAIALLNDNKDIEKVIINAEEVFVPIIAAGELYFGAENSGRVIANLKRVDEFVTRYPILQCDQQTAREYGRIAQKLRVKGRPIRHNDMWIAAIALQHNLTVLTQDAHFNYIDGLTVQPW